MHQKQQTNISENRSLNPEPLKFLYGQKIIDWLEEEQQEWQFPIFVYSAADWFLLYINYALIHRNRITIMHQMHHNRYAERVADLRKIRTLLLDIVLKSNRILLANGSVIFVQQRWRAP